MSGGRGETLMRWVGCIAVAWVLLEFVAAEYEPGGTTTEVVAIVESSPGEETELVDSLVPGDCLTRSSSYGLVDCADPHTREVIFNVIGAGFQADDPVNSGAAGAACAAYVDRRGVRFGAEVEVAVGGEWLACLVVFDRARTSLVYQPASATLRPTLGLDRFELGSCVDVLGQPSDPMFVRTACRGTPDLEVVAAELDLRAGEDPFEACDRAVNDPSREVAWLSSNDEMVVRCLAWSS